MNEMIKAERNKICSRKQTRMLFLAGVVLIVAYFFFFQFNYQNVFYDYDLEKMALASGFTAIEQRKEVAEIFEGKLSQNTLLTMQEKIDQAKQATVGQDENSAFSAVHVYRDQAAILEYLTNSDGSFKSLETAYPNSPTVTLGYCDGWDKLLSGMGSILSIMICLIVVITLSPVFSEEYALHTDSIIYSARYGRTKLTTSKIIAALEVVIGTYLLYLLLNLVLYGCTYGLQGWNVSIQSSLHYASSIYNLTFLQMFFISVILNIFGIVALTTITLFLSAQMSSPVTALITSCVICFLPVVFDFNDSLPVLQKMQEICPYHIAKYVQWYLSDKKKRCKWDELCQCDMQFKSKDGTNKTEEFCENNWLIRDDAQKAIKIYMKNMRTLNTMQIYQKMMNKALNGDVNAAKYVENFHNSDFFEDSEDELDVLLSGINIPALKGGA